MSVPDELDLHFLTAKLNLLRVLVLTRFFNTMDDHGTDLLPTTYFSYIQVHLELI